jgi:hypothetical protein
MHRKIGYFFISALDASQNRLKWTTFNIEQTDLSPVRRMTTGCGANLGNPQEKFQESEKRGGHK